MTDTKRVIAKFNAALLQKQFRKLLDDGAIETIRRALLVFDAVESGELKIYKPGAYHRSIWSAQEDNAWNNCLEKLKEIADGK